MSISHNQPSNEPKTKKSRKENAPSKREKFLRDTISYLKLKGEFYRRGDRIYVNTVPVGGNGLMNLEGDEIKSLFLKVAKEKANLLLGYNDSKNIIDHLRFEARDRSVLLSTDNRAAIRDNKIVIHTGWEKQHMLVLTPSEGRWNEEEMTEVIFEPIPPEMRLVHPIAREATNFPEILKQGIADFGGMHCLVSVSCATMMLPATFPHPFLIFTGDQARGKSTTMKLLLQLIDPYAGGELMSVGEDVRDLIALCQDRHCIALDNVSKLPFDEDLLSKMYSGGIFAARKMTTNSDLSKASMPRLRVMMNGIGTFFSRSDLMSRCIFIEHPVLTKKDNEGHDLFQPTDEIEGRWQAILPEALGSLLDAILKGWKLYQDQGGHAGKTSRCRFVEYAIIGECISQAMGFKEGMFTEQVNKAAQDVKERAVEADDCSQLVVTYLNGESAINHQFNDF